MSDNGKQQMPAPPPRMPKAAELPVELAAAVDTVLAQAQAQIERVVRLGEYARDHGDYIASKCADYAQHCRASADAFAAELLASESRRRSEIEKLIGKGK